jgi:Rnl2 family RNA ligase
LFLGVSGSNPGGLKKPKLVRERFYFSCIEEIKWGARPGFDHLPSLPTQPFLQKGETIMRFQKYSAIDNIQRTETVKKIIKLGHAEVDWVVEEKIHGSNFSIWSDLGDIKFARRMAFLKKGESFPGLAHLREQLTDDVQRVGEVLMNKRDDIDVFAVFGEIFGGYFRHPDVERIDGVPRIMGQVQYSPDVHFMAFDLFINGEFVHYDVAHEVFAEAEILRAEPLFRGSFAEALKHPNAFPSTVPGRLGLPEIEDNVCEGVVLRPVEPRRLPCGSRVILKNKNTKFDEKAKVVNEPKMSDEKLSDEARTLLAELKACVTENRLENVLSKIGFVTIEDFGRVMASFCEDVLDDFLRDFDEPFSQLDGAEQKFLRKQLNKTASPLIRERLLACETVT